MRNTKRLQILPKIVNLLSGALDPGGKGRTAERIRWSDLAPLLKKTSRSFYLSLLFLPATTRGPIALAYLLARGADTIADTTIVPSAERTRWLGAFRVRLTDANEMGLDRFLSDLDIKHHPDGERELLENLLFLFRLHDRLPTEDRQRSIHLLETIAEGMLFDLTWFSTGTSPGVRALEARADLDRYCYQVAGVVGEYWTGMHAAHLPGIDKSKHETTLLGVQFGKGLQMTNILRDIPRDLRRGRCYLPGTDLKALGVQPDDLLEPKNLSRVRSLLDELLAETLENYRAGIHYIKLIPRTQPRLRLCCAWPLVFGLRTLMLLRRSENLLDPDTILKISRAEVYRLMVESASTIVSNRLLTGYLDWLMREAGCRYDSAL